MAAKRVVLTEAEIRASLLTNPNILNEFTFLVPTKTLSDQLSGCMSCQSGAITTQLNASLRANLLTIVSMSDANKARLKELMGAQEVRIYYIAPTPSGNERKKAFF